MVPEEWSLYAREPPKSHQRGATWSEKYPLLAHRVSVARFYLFPFMLFAVAIANAIVGVVVFSLKQPVLTFADAISIICCVVTVVPTALAATVWLQSAIEAHDELRIESLAARDGV
jgi:hypothetical protein